MFEGEDRKSNWKPISLIVLIIGITAITTVMAFNRRDTQIVQTSSLGSYTDQRGIVGSEFHEQFPTFWRTVWTQRDSETSDFFYIEAETLDGVLALEKELAASNPPKDNWRFCKTTKL